MRRGFRSQDERSARLPMRITGLIKFIVPRGAVLVDINGAVLYRMIEKKWHPTLIVDEADDTFKTSPELRQVINSGWTRGAGRSCVVIPTRMSRSSSRRLVQSQSG